MKHVITFLTIPALLLTAGLAPAAASEEKTAPIVHAKYCPAGANFKSRVDEKLNSLNLEDLTAVADKGNTAAQVLLGLRYTSGENQNMEKAVALFQAAANKKDSDGEYYMATAYLNGAGVPKDEAQAALWFKRSADRGHPVSQFWFGEMTAKGRGGLTADWKAALPYFEKAARSGMANAFVEIALMYHYGYGGFTIDYEKSATCNRIARGLGSQLAQYNIGRMIYDDKIKWQPGDPKKSDAPPPAAAEIK